MQQANPPAEHRCFLYTVNGVTNAHRAECLECDYVGPWHEDTFAAVKEYERSRNKNLKMMKTNPLPSEIALQTFSTVGIGHTINSV